MMETEVKRTCNILEEDGRFAEKITGEQHVALTMEYPDGVEELWMSPFADRAYWLYQETYDPPGHPEWSAFAQDKYLEPPSWDPKLEAALSLLPEDIRQYAQWAFGFDVT